MGLRFRFGNNFVRQSKYMNKTGLLNAFRFATLVWLMAVFGAPITFFLFDWIIVPKLDWEHVSFFIGMAILCGAIFSIPSWLLLILSTHLVTLKIEEIQAKKMLLFVIGYLLTFIPFFLLFQRDIKYGPDSGFFLCYWGFIAVGIIFYKLNR